MSRKSKKFRQALEQYDRTAAYSVEEAIEVLKRIKFARFDEAVEAHFRLGIDPKKSDQTVRSTVVLPHGTGKTPRVIVFTKADKISACEQAGADLVGAEDLVGKVKEGFSDFDIAVASPDMMGLVGKELGRILGPRMPNPRAGTVTPDPAKAVQELKSGKMQFRADKFGIVHTSIGRVGFDSEKIHQNFQTLLDAVVRARPAAAKGTYLKTIYLTTTMGPSVRVDPQKAAVAAAATGR